MSWYLTNISNTKLHVSIYKYIAGDFTINLLPHVPDLTPKPGYTGSICATQNGQIPLNSKKEFTCQPATFGRMVMIINTKVRQQISICEMEVFGQDRFSYGSSCKYHFIDHFISGCKHILGNYSMIYLV